MRPFILAAAIIMLKAPPSEAQASYARSADGLRIAYSDRGHGPVALVFVHGWACNREHWAEQLRHFAAHYRVITVDLPGHGESDAERAAWSIEAFGQDIADVIDHAGLRRVVLIGHSAGGFSVLEAARLRPREVVVVIGVDAFRNVAAGYFERRYTAEELASFAAPLRASFRDAMAAQVRNQFFLAGADSTVVARVAADMSTTRPDVAIPAMLAFYQYRNGRQLQTLREVGARTPVVAFNAARSRLDPTVFGAHVRRFEVFTMPDVGHFPMLERPADFNARLETILAGLGV